MKIPDMIKKAVGKFSRARQPEIAEKEKYPTSKDSSDRPKINYAKINPKQVNRIMDKVRNDYKELGKYRKAMRTIKQQVAGHMFFQHGFDKALPYNKILQVINVYTRQLASGLPQIAVEAKYDEHIPFAKKLELACNRHFREINLDEVFNDGLIESMCGVAIAKTGIAEGDAEYEIDGQFHDPGKPFTDIIRIDDFVIDMQATKKSAVELVGDRFLRPREWVKQQYDLYGVKLDAEQIEELGVKQANESEMNISEERVGGAKEDSDHRLSDDLWVWHFYLPKWNLTMMIPDGFDIPICVKEYDGPEGGPYDFLGYLWPSDFVLPIPPVAQMYDLHELTNLLGRKLGQQAKDAKSVPFVEGGWEDELEKMRMAGDHEAIVIKPGAKEHMGQMDFPGADPSLHQWNGWNLQQIDDLMGGMQMMAGIGAASETASQDKMIASQQNTLLDVMRQRTLKWATAIMKKHAWFLWTDPIREMELSYILSDLPDGLIIRVPMRFTPEEREGDFLDYNFSIEPYSIKDETPQEKLQKYMMYLSQVVLPLQEQMMQSGAQIDFMELSKLIGELLNIKVDRIVKMADPEVAAMMAQMGAIGQVPAPSRFKQSHTVNERISRPGTSPRNSQVNMAAAYPTAGGGNNRGGQGGITTVGEGS